MDMVHIVPKNSLISATIMELFPFAFLCIQLTFFNHLMLLSFNPTSIVILRQLMQPHEFLEALTSIYEQTFKKTTVLSAFRQTGLIPFNYEIVLSKLNKPISRPGSILSLNTRPQCCLPSSNQVHIQAHLPAPPSLQVQQSLLPSGYSNRKQTSFGLLL